MELFFSIALMVLYFWYLPYRNRQHAAKKLTQFRKAEAVIIDKWISMPAGARPWTAPNLMRSLNLGGGSTAPCNLQYEFLDFRGEKITHTAILEDPLNDWRALGPGDKIEICYSPEKTGESYPVEYLERIKNNAPQSGGFLLLAIITLILFISKYL